MDGGGRLLRSVKEGFLPSYAHAPALNAPTPRRMAGRAGRRRLRFSLFQFVARLPSGFGTALSALLLVSSAGYGLVRGGHYDTFIATYGDPAQFLGRVAGFGVDHVTINGIADLSEREVLEAARIHDGVSLPFFDVETARQNLMAIPLVKDASVRKIYPDTIEITLTEREGFALWQNRGEIAVIAADGAVIDHFQGERFAALPLVVGEGAAGRASGILATIDAVPGLKPHIRAAVLVAGRRWSLKLVNGMDVKLPEDNLPEALQRLDTLIREQKVLDKAILAIDLRQPDRVVLRLTEEAAASRSDILKARAKLKGNPT
jgi:cell division protein FtsQ